MTGGIGTVLNTSSRNINYLIETNGPWFIIKIIGIFLIFLRIISIIWVAKDISNRTNKTFVQIVCILLVTVLSPIIGLPLYIIMRPVFYKKDMIPRREATALQITSCYNCHTLNKQENEYCTHCGEPLMVTCKKCGHKCCYHHNHCEKCWWPNFDS